MSIRYLPDSPPPPRTRNHAAIWAAARADYLAGGSAAEVCERHGLSVSTFRWRARNEGWRRADHAETPADAPFTAEALDDAIRLDLPGAESPFWDDVPARSASAPAHDQNPYASYPQGQSSDWNAADEAPPIDPTATASELAATAWFQASRAIRAGRMIEARGWTRLHRDLLATARADEKGQRMTAALTRDIADVRTIMAGWKEDRGEE